MSTISLIILITPIVVKALLKPRLERGTLRRKKKRLFFERDALKVFISF